MKTLIILLLLLPARFTGAQKYLFNGDTTALFYKGFTNTFIIKKTIENSGTPLCFDGTIKTTLSQNSNLNPKYYVEVLDTVTREKGSLNICKKMRHPDGFEENVFIDKLYFKMVPLPEIYLFIGDTETGNKLNKDKMELKIGIRERFPKTEFKIEEYTIVVNKEELSEKNTQLTPQAKSFILKQKEGEEIKISVVYVDLANKKRRVEGVFYL